MAERSGSPVPGRILLGGILLAALAFGALLLWRRSSSDPREEGAPPIVQDVSSLQREHAERMAEDAAERERRKGARSLEALKERVEKSASLTPEQKQLIVESRETVDRIVDEAKADHKKELAELEEARRRAQETLDRRKEEKEKEKKSLTFAVELASSTILPCQPLVARFRVTNVGAAPVPIVFSLDPEACFISGEIAPAGSTNFQSLRLGKFDDAPFVGGPNAPQLNPGGTITFQSDLSLFLGYEPGTKSVSSGSFTLRLHLNVGSKGGGTVTTDDLSVIVAPATGDERAVLDRIVQKGYLSFLGTQALRTAPQALSGSPEVILADLQSICSQFPGSAYVRDLRAGYFRAVAAWWTGLLKTRTASDLAAQVRPMAEDYWRRDCPASWPRAESLLYYARVCNFAGEEQREKDALLKFGQVCGQDARAPGVAQTLLKRP
jgi:hypothetical protein